MANEIEVNYAPNYCLQLEAAYGNGMMSEGCEEGIEHMFDSTALNHKRAIDIGCGLGGVAFYLAEKYGMEIIGLEVNDWMVEEAKRRIPKSLKQCVQFLRTESNQNWPLTKNSYDIIYSKEVLSHLDIENKMKIFEECYHLLKDEGEIVFTDWLSGESRKWEKNIIRLVELEEDLIIFPESKTGYHELLKQSGFKNIKSRDESKLYQKFNEQIVSRLKDPALLQSHLKHFTHTELEASIEGYECIFRALQTEELKIIRFTAHK